MPTLLPRLPRWRSYSKLLCAAVAAMSCRAVRSVLPARASCCCSCAAVASLGCPHPPGPSPRSPAASYTRSHASSPCLLLALPACLVPRPSSFSFSFSFSSFSSPSTPSLKPFPSSRTPPLRRSLNARLAVARRYISLSYLTGAYRERTRLTVGRLSESLYTSQKRVGVDACAGMHRAGTHPRVGPQQERTTMEAESRRGRSLRHSVGSIFMKVAIVL